MHLLRRILVLKINTFCFFFNSSYYCRPSSFSLCQVSLKFTDFNLMAVIINAIGDFGKYQLWICFLIFVSNFGIAFHHLAIIILAPPIKYSCPDLKRTCCDNPIYDQSLFKRTIIMEWNLICKRTWLKELTQTLFQLGVVFGSVLFGIASDRYGRRISMICAVILEVFSGVMCSFLPDYWSFTIVRMILGIAVGGVMVVGFVIVMEIVGNVHRYIIAAAYQMPFTIGHMLIPLFGCIIRDYMFFQLTISLTTIVLLFYICLLPESPRWLLAVNKTVEGIELLEKIANINNRPTNTIRQNVMLHLFQNRIIIKKNVNVFNLFRTSRIRRNILIMSYLWFSVSCCFYGLSQYISYLSGDLLINVTASGGVCLIACIIAIPVMKFMNRKTMVILFNGSCTLFLFIVIFLPEGSADVVFHCLALLCSFVVFIVVYLYTSEMFPTVVRNAALGITSMAGRFGAMFAPFIAGLNAYGPWYAPVTFGTLPLIASILCIWLPETKDCILITSIEEGEELGKTPTIPDANNGEASTNIESTT